MEGGAGGDRLYLLTAFIKCLATGDLWRIGQINTKGAQHFWAAKLGWKLWGKHLSFVTCVQKRAAIQSCRVSQDGNTVAVFAAIFWSLKGSFCGYYSIINSKVTLLSKVELNKTTPRCNCIMKLYIMGIRLHLFLPLFSSLADDKSENILKEAQVQNDQK